MSITRKAGFNLIEAAIVLGVVGLIIGAIWVAASAVHESRRMERAQTQALAIIKNVQHMYGNQRLAASVTVNATTNTNLVASLFPADAVQNNRPYHPWGGDYSLFITSAQIFLTLENLNVKACTALGPRLAGGLKTLPESVVQTEEEEGNVGTVATSAASCQNEFDEEGSADIEITVGR